MTVTVLPAYQPPEPVISKETAARTGWLSLALCADTDAEAFFPEVGANASVAKKVCRACEVRTDCLDYALARNEEFGIWGGLSGQERRELRRAKAAA